MHQKVVAAISITCTTSYRFAIEEVLQDLAKLRRLFLGHVVAAVVEQEAAELALCTLATNKSLAVLSRAGFSSEDLATVAELEMRSLLTMSSSSRGVPHATARSK